MQTYYDDNDRIYFYATKGYIVNSLIETAVASYMQKLNSILTFIN